MLNIFWGILRQFFGGTRTTAIVITSSTSAVAFSLPKGDAITAIQTDADYATGDLTLQATLGVDTDSPSTYVDVVDARADLVNGGATLTITGAAASKHYEFSPPVQVGQGQLTFGASQGGTSTTIYIKHRPYS